MRTVLDQLAELQSLLRSHRDGILRDHGLSGAQYAVLTYLAERESNPPAGGELAKAVRVRPQTMFETLERLDQQRLIERPGPVGPGFARRARLGRRGRILLEQCRARLVDLEHHLLEHHSASQVEMLQDVLDACILQLLALPEPSGSR